MKPSRNILQLLVLAALPVLACTPGADTESQPSAEAVLPFIEDDYATALAEARTREVPLFIESWAPW